jgi:hypothetical protein
VVDHRNLSWFLNDSTSPSTSNGDFLLGFVKKICFLQEHNTFELDGSFLVEKSLNKNLQVTLTVDDEDKIEFFEVKTPSGKRKMFPTYLDRYCGLLIFKSGIPESNP